MKISVIILAIGTLLSKGLGLLREMFLAQKFGTGYISDSFILSLSILEVILTSFAAAINTNYIPIISKIDNKKDEELKRFNGILITTIFIISTIIVILFYCFSRQFVKLFAYGYSDEKLTFVVNISKISIFSVYFILITYVFQGFLEYKRSFSGTALKGILLNVGLLLGLALSSVERYYILGIGILLGYFLSYIYIFILAKKNGFSLKLNFDFRNENLKILVILTLPLLFNSTLWELHGLIDKSIASTIGAGYISSLNYANYISTSVVSIFVTSIGTVIFPRFALMVSKNDMNSMKEEVKVLIKSIFSLVLPCIILIFIFAPDIIRVLFFRGEFSENSFYITTTALKLYSLSILFSSLQTIMFKIFYAFQDTKTPTISACISIILNIVLNLILSKLIGYTGIIIATIVSTAVSSIWLIFNVNKKVKNTIDKCLIFDIIKIILLNVILFILVILLYKFFPELNIYNQNFSILFKDIIITILIVVIYGGYILWRRKKSAKSNI